MMDGCAIPMADMIAANGPDLSHVNLFKDFEVESFPATDLNPKKALSDPAVFLNKQFPTDTATGPITKHGANDPPGSMRAPVKAVAGTTYFRCDKFKALPWGNYSTTCIDPSEPRRLWTYQQYVNSTNDGQWCTAWTSFQLDPAPGG